MDWKDWNTMGVVILILVLTAIIGGVILNHRTQAAALAGTEFEVSEPPHVVAEAIAAAYCGKILRGLFSGVSVQQRGSTGFALSTKLGDRGEIEVHPRGAGSVVRASASSLYIGGVLRSGNGSPIWVLSKVLTDVIYKMLRLAPNASRMKRFQRGIERKVVKRIA